MNASTRRIRISIGAFAAVVSLAASAYETPVHRDMTQAAFTQSVRDRDFLLDLGVLHLFDAQGNLATDDFLGIPALGWVMLGSIYEDNNIRSRFHFYDPLASGSQGLMGAFQSAPDWAFNATDNATYSLPGTRQSLYGALTNTDTIVRPKMWRDTFRGVGQFTHLLQDMAQPQHVRNDQHFSLTEQFYYIFPDYSRYEKRTLFLNNQGLLNFTGYPSVILPTYRGYWSDNSGLALSTNLNFVSEGTNLDTGRYGSPLGTLLKEEEIAQVFDVAGNPVAGATAVTVQYVSYSYTDPYTGEGVVNDRLSAYSLFDFQRLQATGTHAFTLYNTNHERYAELLIPRAVGYSSGLINRFFRGSLDITAPDEKVYGIVDHSTIHQTDPVNGFVGFNVIKLKVRNATSGTVAEAAMTGGKLVAVAKFHRNGCYKDDLTGEFSASGTPTCALSSYRTDTEEIVVSNTYPNVSLDVVNPTPFTFTFAQPIPINATDLFIQVVYRGPLGADADEIAVGTKDVFEPTYLAIFNSTDQFLYNGNFIDTTSTPPPDLDVNPHDGTIDAQYDRTDIQLRFAFTDGPLGTPLATVDALPPQRYSRVALLTDRTPYPMPIQTFGVAFNTNRIFQFTPERNQVDITTGGYRVSQFGTMRGIPVWNNLTMYKFFGSPDTGDMTSLPALANKAPVALTTLNFNP